MNHPSLLTKAVFGLVLAAALLASPAAQALPSFARQMNMQCTDCHTEFPVLNQYGRQFKLMGYTLSADQPSDMLPIAVMLQPSFTRTQAPQAGGAAPGFSDNNNFAVTQTSLFYAGRLFGPFASALFGNDGAAFANKFGIFSQTTYDGVAKAWHWDNTELRFADTGTVGEHDLIYGVYANNNPTMQDPWNSTPAWGFPFSGSGLAPGPAAGTMIDGGFAQEVAGLGVYTMVDNTFYFDVGAYRMVGSSAQKSLGIDPSGEAEISGLAPYWRFAVDKMVGEGRWEAGIFGMASNTYPGQDSSAGTDRVDDFGFDSQYQLSQGKSDLTAMLSTIYEREDWNASSVLGNTSNTSDTLHETKATAVYLYDKTYGASVQYFVYNGSSDALLYGGSQTGSPFSDGFVLQATWLPFNKGGGPSFWPRSNIKCSLQYTVYNRFNGARTNYDGAGSNAQDNNTLYAEVWIVF
jgi:hypothetical protein